MKSKQLLTLLSLAVLTSCNNVESSNINDEIERIDSSALDASTSYISLEKYKDKVKGGIVGSMAGVAYGFPKNLNQRIGLAKVSFQFGMKKWCKMATIRMIYI